MGAHKGTPEANTHAAACLEHDEAAEATTAGEGSASKVPLHSGWPHLPQTEVSPVVVLGGPDALDSVHGLCPSVYAVWQWDACKEARSCPS